MPKKTYSKATSELANYHHTSWDTAVTGRTGITLPAGEVGKKELREGNRARVRKSVSRDLNRDVPKPARKGARGERARAGHWTVCAREKKEEKQSQTGSEKAMEKLLEGSSGKEKVPSAARWGSF